MKTSAALVALLVLVAGGGLWADDLGGRLIKAAADGKLDQVTSLVRQGAGINSRDGDGQTALMTAVDEGHRDVVIFLLDNGADVNLMDHMGITALAQSISDPQMLRLLLGRGADANAGMPALTAAAWTGSTEAVGLLLEAGADMKAEGPEGTALATACMRGHGDVVRQLLERGADPYASDAREGSLYEIAEKNRHADVIPILIAAGVRGPVTIASKYSVRDAPSLPASQFPDLAGTWYNPAGMAVPGVHAKEVFNRDLSGALYDEIDDASPMAAFTYRVTWHDRNSGVYHILIDYGRNNTWYGVTRISQQSGRKEWDFLGQAVTNLPKDINPKSQFYGRAFRTVEGRDDTRWLVGTWIYPAGAATSGVIGKEVFNADGTGAIYDLEKDATPWAAFGYQVVCRMPDEPVYHVIITYGPGNVWYMAYRLSADGRQKEGDAAGMNKQFFPADVTPRGPFYGVAKKR
jgi:hypothetical protein